MYQESNGIALARLVALLGAGYQIDVKSSVAVGTTVWLVHPSGWKKAKEETLLLSGDGQLVGLEGEPPERQFRLGPDDTDRFRSFLASVPQPTWWEKNRRYFYAPVGWILFFGFAYAISRGIEWLWRSL